MSISKWRDKWFYYKIITVFLILGGLIAVYLYHMISQTWFRNIVYPFSYLLFQGQFWSFFTFQSNLIVGVWFLIATIYHQQKNYLIDSPSIVLAITSYISVTCFVYLVILFPGFFISGTEINIEDIITGPYFHILTPILMIVYSLTHVSPIPLSAKKYYSKNFFLFLIYPWSYTIYLVLRLFIYANISSLQKVPFAITYPYLAIFKATGNVINDIAAENTLGFIIEFFIIVHCLFIIFNLIYFFIFKKMRKRK